MKISNAIDYLQNDNISLQERFKILTGFDTQANAKDIDPRFWVNALFQKGIMTRLGSLESTASIGAAVGALFGSSGSTMVRLKTHFKDACKNSETQVQSQEKYIALVTELLNKYKNQDQELLAFDFTDPKALAAITVQPEASNTATNSK